MVHYMVRQENQYNAVVDEDTGRAEVTVLCNGLGKISKRRQESVLRTHNLNMARESKKYFSSQLMLHWPL